MRRTSLIVAMLVMLVGIPVQAQKVGRIKRPILPPVQVVVQSDAADGYMVFDLSTGAFTCMLCEYGYEMSGVGEVKIDGCNIYFYAITGEYNIFATVDKCGQQAKVGVEMHSKDPEFEVYESWSDANLLDSKMDCGIPPEK